MTELQHKIDQLLCLYGEIKEEIRRTDKSLYERWKAGGFLVDDNIVSMYPALQEVSDCLPEEDEECDGCGEKGCEGDCGPYAIDEHDERNNLKE